MTRREALLATAALTTLGCPSTEPGTTVAPADSWGDLAADIPGDGDVAQWLTGGSASLSAPFRDPFEGWAPPAQCTLTCSQTLGPCFVPAPLRRDITTGIAGLPMRLALLILRAEDCAPVANADVDLWSCDLRGVYSGDTPSPICADADPPSRALDFMRGMQTTNDDGRVDFDLVFPGWYGGRAPHLHLQVRVGGEEIVTTQLYFDDAFAAALYTEHADYASRGAHDTSLDADIVIQGTANAQPFIPQLERTPEGALLAWTSIALRSSTGEPLCAAVSG